MIKSWWWQAAFIILSILFGVGVLLLITRPPRGKPIELLPAPTQSPIMVHVNGAVNKVGLYALPLGSRVNDAIQAAGGFTDNANIDVLNLAKTLEDGELVYVPELGSPGQAPIQPGMDSSPLILVNINIAELEQLDTLPEIGPKTAQNIIDYRNANGPFERIEDIQNVPGIGQVTFDKIKELITTGTSP